MKLYDTATRQVRDLVARPDGEIRMYVCGPTVYGPPHLGHGRFALVFDVLRRYLAWRGFRVRYVSNITDVDDKIIAAAAVEGTSPEEFAARWEEVWWEVMDTLGVQRPDHDPHASAYVTHMVELAARLEERGFAYTTSTGLYFDVSRLEDYGLLAGQSTDHLLAGARVEVDEEKRSPLDFALWKFAKPGEPKWPSPWGEGRPGWHTECVVMSMDLLGEEFELHGGGRDLAFPHHENERAQATAVGCRFARHWVHNGFVEVEGEKMSKSLGNFVDLTDLLRRADPRALRMLVLRSHYRSPMEVDQETVRDAEGALQRLDALARRGSDLPAAEADAGLLDRFAQAMDDDLDTPRATALLFQTVREANAALDSGDSDRAAHLVATVRSICETLGLSLGDGEERPPPEIEELVRARDAARRAKDWAAADRIRESLRERGWLVEDSPAGTKVRRASSSRSGSSS
ncbi:MAG: cysteine--tRNA ligase [Acidimicrobiales bacterium]|nr:MAG: cysteine--tRNA ligase [Acidimicrobiales bacterium]